MNHAFDLPSGHRPGAFDDVWRRSRSALVACLTACVVVVTGCQTMSDGASSAGAWVRDNTLALQGCAVGLAGGALLGYLASRKKVGVLVGGVAGCAIGAAAASELDRRRKAYATKEEFHEAEKRRLAELNASLREENAQRKRQIALYDREIERLASAASAQRTRAEELRAQVVADKASADERVDDALVELALKDKVAKELEEDGKSGEATALRAEADELETEIAELKELVDDYNRQTAALGQFV